MAASLPFAGELPAFKYVLLSFSLSALARAAEIETGNKEHRGSRQAPKIIL